MRTSLNKATVDTPDTLYTNVVVYLESDDDVTMTATVSNRQGVILVVLVGTWRYESGAWVIDLPSGGVATIMKQAGCGCGGSGVEAKPAQGNMMAGVYEP